MVTAVSQPFRRMSGDGSIEMLMESTTLDALLEETFADVEIICDNKEAEEIIEEIINNITRGK